MLDGSAGTYQSALSCDKSKKTAVVNLPLQILEDERKKLQLLLVSMDAAIAAVLSDGAAAKDVFCFTPAGVFAGV